MINGGTKNSSASWTCPFPFFSISLHTLLSPLHFTLPYPSPYSLPSWNSLPLQLRERSRSTILNFIEDGDRGALRLIVKNAAYNYAYFYTFLHIVEFYTACCMWSENIFRERKRVSSEVYCEKTPMRMLKSYANSQVYEKWFTYVRLSHGVVSARWFQLMACCKTKRVRQVGTYLALSTSITRITR